MKARHSFFALGSSILSFRCSEVTTSDCNTKCRVKLLNLGRRENSGGIVLHIIVEHICCQKVLTFSNKFRSKRDSWAPSKYNASRQHSIELTSTNNPIRLNPVLCAKAN